MKNKIKLVIIILLFYIIFYSHIALINKDTFNTLLNTFIPSLLPLFIISNIFIESDGITYLYNKLKTSKLKRQLFYFFICFILLNIGIPGSINIINKLHNTHLLNDKNKNALLYSLGTTSFPFVYGICLNNVTDKKLSLFILIIYLLVNVSFLYFLDFKIDFNQNPKITKVSNKEIINKSINVSIKNIAIISITILMSSSVLFLLNNIPEPFNYYIEGFIEFSYSSYNLSLSKNNVAIILMISTLTFPSLSTLIQIKLIDTNFKIIPFITKRCLISITIVILFIFFSFFYIFK